MHRSAAQARSHCLRCRRVAPRLQCLGVVVQRLLPLLVSCSKVAWRSAAQVVSPAWLVPSGVHSRAAVSLRLTSWRHVLHLLHCSCSGQASARALWLPAAPTHNPPRCVLVARTAMWTQPTRLNGALHCVSRVWWAERRVAMLSLTGRGPLEGSVQHLFT
jgi:hypothetical protein